LIPVNEDSDLKQLEQATFRIANQDGLTEILMGLMIIAVGALIIDSIFVVYVALLIIFPPVLIERIKEKYTYPRIGRVKLKEDSESPYGPHWAVFALVMLVALSSVIISSRIDNEILNIIARWAPLIMGIGLLQPFVFLVQRSGLKGYYGVGAIIAVLGAVFVLLDFDSSIVRMSLYLLVVGGLLFLAGLVSMVRFVRKYPVLDLEDVGYEQD
jgi:hypothetical protein